MRRAVPISIVLTTALALTVPAAELPEMRINPSSGALEGVEAVIVGADSDVRHVVDPGPGQDSQITWVTSTTVDDREPTIEFDDDGDTWVSWWRDETVDTIRFRRLDRSTGSWGSERAVDDTGSAARRPALGYDGDGVWVAYEREIAGGTAIVAAAIIDDAEPVGTYHEVATTGSSGDRDVMFHAQGGQFWITWVDDGDDVGYAEWKAGSGTWDTPAYESYANDTVTAARARIEAALTN